MASQGSLLTERPALVQGLVEDEGEGSSSGITVFRIQSRSYSVLCKKFSCQRVCYSPARVFFTECRVLGRGGRRTVQRTDVGARNKLGKRGVERGIT